MEYVAHELGVPVVQLPALQRSSRPRRMRRRCASSVALITRRRADVLHTHTAKAGATAGSPRPLAGGARPRATVHTFHGHVLSGLLRHRAASGLHPDRAAAGATTGAIVAVSDEVRDDLVRLGVAPPEKIVVIPYGFDLSGSGAAGRRRAGRAARGDRAARGRIRRRLGRPADARSSGPTISSARWPSSSRADATPTSWSSATGPSGASVEALAGELGVADRCRFLGYRRDMSRWYGTFDAFLLTSENEGTPVVAIEALASGCPVVATDAGGTATVVRDGETRLPRAGRGHARSGAPPARARDDPELARSLGDAGALDVRAGSPRRRWRTPSRRSTGGCSPRREGPPHPQDHRRQRLRAAPADAAARPARSAASTPASSGSTSTAAMRRASTGSSTTWGSVRARPLHTRRQPAHGGEVVRRVRRAGPTSSTRTSSTATSTARSRRAHAGAVRLVAPQRRPLPARAVPLRRPPFARRARRHHRDLGRRARVPRAAGLPREKLLTIHYGLDELPRSRRRRRRPSSGSRRDAPLVLAIGRLIAQKDHATLLRAFARVHAEHPEARLAILGSGPLEAETRALGGELGLDDAVFLPGRLAIREWLERANVFVHTSPGKGSGSCCSRRCSPGFPVVATRVSAVPEVVGDGETGSSSSRATWRPGGGPLGAARRPGPARRARARPGATRAGASSRSRG